MNSICMKITTPHKCRECGEPGLFYIKKEGKEGYWCSNCHAESKTLLVRLYKS